MGRTQSSTGKAWSPKGTEGRQPVHGNGEVCVFGVPSQRLGCKGSGALGAGAAMPWAEWSQGQLMQPLRAARRVTVLSHTADALEALTRSCCGHDRPRPGV